MSSAAENRPTLRMMQLLPIQGNPLEMNLDEISLVGIGRLGSPVK